MPILEAENLPDRMRAAVTESWQLFSRTVGSGLIPINKETSMQLQFAYILQQLAPLITFHEHEALQACSVGSICLFVDVENRARSFRMVEHFQTNTSTPCSTVGLKVQLPISRQFLERL